MAKDLIQKIASKIRAALKGKNLFTVIAAVLFIIMYFQIQSILGTFSFLQGRDSSLIDEIGQMRDSYIRIGEDLNEVREYLRMPSGNYAILDNAKNDEEDNNTNSVQLAMFRYFDDLVNSKKAAEDLQKNRTYFEKIIDAPKFREYIESEELALSAVTEEENSLNISIVLPSEQSEKPDFEVESPSVTIASLNLDKKTGSFTFETFKEKKKLEFNKYENFEEYIINYLKKQKSSLVKNAQEIEKLRTHIESTIASENIQNVIASFGISISRDPKETDLRMTYEVYNRSLEVIGEIVLNTDNSEIWLLDKNNPSYSTLATNISTAIVPYLKKLDISTPIDKKVSDAVKNIEETISDKGFQLLLKESEFTISSEPRETEERFYFDIFDASKKLLNSIVVDKSTGVINIVGTDGANAENLLFFDPDFKKKTLEIPENIPEYKTQADKDDTFNVLVAGKHGSLVDTMIFAHINETKRTVRMISIPRDLFYNGRKINSYAFYYGMPELKKAISKITGYELDKYILIDMYAFIDVVDLIGGVDLRLDKPVIDPSYKVINNGVASTLHYDAGDYHLSGVEALRLARSRKTSSDFARAERQQLILSAIQTKARNFGFGDADTIYEIVKTVLNKTETDISIDEAIAYFFRYQNYKIETMDVMSSGNVLYVPPYITTEQCNQLIAAAKASGQPTPGCENQNHAYTLIPKDNNWNVVKWFFREKFGAV